MKHLDEYRDARRCNVLLERIRQIATKRWVLMDVCGGQTHSLVRSGIEQQLHGVVELIHGPGCPVCVTPAEVIEFAIALAMRSDTIVATFGDMMRVPGSRRSLADARGKGGAVQIVYSPIDAVELARKNPAAEVVFLAVGFETTAPATALAVLQANQANVTNFSIVPAHVRVQPAMEAIVQSEGNRVQGFLAAGHVCAITGFASYHAFVRQHNVPVVVTGFEPVDLLEGIMECVSQLERREPAVVNRYGRTVSENGNLSAKNVIARTYRIVDKPWRGFGVIRDGGLELRDELKRFDAYQLFPKVVPGPLSESGECRGAEVMSGKIKPKQCPAFGSRCTPESPLGAPMVSSEGACAAYYRFDPIQISLPTGSK